MDRRALDGGNPSGVEDAEVKVEVDSGPAARDWNVVAAAVRADKETGLVQGSGLGYRGRLLVLAGREGKLCPGPGQPAGGSEGSWGWAGQGSPFAA